MKMTSQSEGTLADLKINELRSMASRMSISAGGKKVDIINRIISASNILEEHYSVAVDEDNSNINSVSIEQKCMDPEDQNGVCITKVQAAGTVQDTATAMRSSEIFQPSAISCVAPRSPRSQSITLLETSSMATVFEKEFDIAAGITEYSSIMEMSTSIYDSQDHLVTHVSESMRITDISSEVKDRWSMDEAVATTKLRLMFGSMQARLSAIATPKEMAFLQRTFNLSMSTEDQVTENLEKATVSPRKGSAKSAPSSPKKPIPNSSGAIPRKAWSPSNKIDVIKSVKGDDSMTHTFARNLPFTPGKDSKGPCSRVSSLTSTKKYRQPYAVTSSASTFGAVTPSRASGRNSSISTTTAEGSIIGTETQLTAPKAGSLGSVGKCTTSRMQSSTRTMVTLSSSVASTSDTTQPNVVRALFGSAKLPRPPAVPSRYAQASTSGQTPSHRITVLTGDPASDNSRNNTSNGSKVVKGTSSSVRTDARATSAIKADRPISVPLRRPTALVLNQGLSSSGELSSQSTPMQRSQSQRTPTGKRVASVSVPPSPSKSAPGLAVKKVEIGKLFGLVGFTKVEVAPSQVIPFAAISSLITPRATDTGATQLDRTMKDAMQRSIAAKASLLAAEMAAENARLEAMVAHAEALAAARAVVKEEETGRSALVSNRPVGPLGNITAPSLSTNCPSTITTPDTPLSPSDTYETITKKDCWMKPGSTSDDLSPKREAENPFKGML